MNRHIMQNHPVRTSNNNSSEVRSNLLRVPAVGNQHQQMKHNLNHSHASTSVQNDSIECLRCKEIIPKYNYLDHLQQHQQHELQSNFLRPQRLQCPYCNKLFGKLYNLKRHVQMHEKEDHESLNRMTTIRTNSDVDHLEVNSSNLATSSLNKPGSLTLTPALLSNLNKLASLKSGDCRDGKKPAILININTNNPSKDVDLHSHEMAEINKKSRLVINSISNVDKKYENIDKLNLFNQRSKRESISSLTSQSNESEGSTVLIHNGKKAVSLSALQCPICKKVLSEPFSLKVHLRTHTGEIFNDSN